MYAEKAAAKIVLMGPGGPVSRACQVHTMTRVSRPNSGGMSHVRGPTRAPTHSIARVAGPTTSSILTRLRRGASRPVCAAWAPMRPIEPSEGPKMRQETTSPVATAAHQRAARAARPGSGCTTTRLRPSLPADRLALLTRVSLGGRRPAP